MTHRRSFLKAIGSGGLILGLRPPFSPAAYGAESAGLRRSSPEDQGISSEAILAFLEAWEAARSATRTEPHSLMIARHGEVVAECWWSPYRAYEPHSLYSLGKIVLSTAIGLAVTEGKLSVDDRIVDIFSDNLAVAPSDSVKSISVRHLLAGATGHNAQTIAALSAKLDRFDVADFLAAPVSFEPGSRFSYNPPASVMLGACIEKIYGERLPDFLRPRLVRPLGMREPVWSPRGKMSYPSGLITEDILKIGLLHLWNGSWRGQRILSEQWVRDATRPQISTPDVPIGPDWRLGYGYQFWIGRDGAYRVDGAIGQHCIVLPEHDAVIAITSETFDLQTIVDLVWKYLVPAMRHEPVAPAGLESRQARRAMSEARLGLPIGKPSSIVAADVSRKTYNIEPNEIGMESVSFDLKPGACHLSLKFAEVVSEIPFSFARWVGSQPPIPDGLANPISKELPRPMKIAAAAAWADADTLEMIWHLYQTPHSIKLRAKFRGDDLEISFFASSINKEIAVLRGHSE